MSPLLFNVFNLLKLKWRRFGRYAISHKNNESGIWYKNSRKMYQILHRNGQSGKGVTLNTFDRFTCRKSNGCSVLRRTNKSTICQAEKMHVFWFNKTTLPDPGVGYEARKYHQTHSIDHRPVPMTQHSVVDCMNTISVNHNPFDLKKRQTTRHHSRY